MAQQSKKPAARKAPKYSSDAMAMRYIVGLVLVAVGGLMFMATAMTMEGTVFEAVRSFTFGLAGSLAVALPILPVWGGILLMMSAQRKAPLRAFVMVTTLYLLVLTAVTLICQTRGASGAVSLMDYFLETNQARYNNPADYDLFLYRGYELGRDRHLGGGVFGMLLAWPIWRLMGAVPGCMAAIALALGNVVLLFRKEIAQISGKVKARNDQRRQMSEREQAEIRAREQQWRMQQEQLRQQQMQQPYQQPYPAQPQPEPVVHQGRQPAPMAYGYHQPVMGEHGRNVRVGFQPHGREQYEQMSPDVICQEEESYSSSLREERSRNRSKLRMPQLFGRKREEQPAGGSRPVDRPVRAAESHQQPDRSVYRRPEPAKTTAEPAPGRTDTPRPRRARQMADWQTGEAQPQTNVVPQAEPASEPERRPEQEQPVYQPEPVSEHRPETVYPADPEPVRDPEPAYQPEPAPEYKPQPAYQPEPAPEYKPQPAFQPEPAPEYKPQPMYQPEPAPEYKPQHAYQPEPAPEHRAEAVYPDAPGYTRDPQPEPYTEPKAVVQETMHVEPAVKAQPKAQTPWQRALQEKRAQAAGASAETAVAADVPAAAETPAPSKETPAFVVPKVQQPAPRGVWQPELNLPPRKDPGEEPAETEPERPYVYPPVSLLREPQPYTADQENEDSDRIEALEEMLHHFNYPARVVHVTHGPRISRFELEVGEGVLLNRIANLEENILAKMSVPSINLQTPIPGTSYVGVEIPNRKSQIVTFREVLESPEMRESKSPLTIALGRDIGGKPVICDITRMPHMLIAGKTKSGKSVCINALINSIIFRASPKEVRMILVDPKVVELKRYNVLPHLLLPVITDMSKAAAALEWAVAEMMERYNRLADRDVPNIDEYNASLAPGEERMPYILIIIDEMADLMMQHGKNVEGSIMRLAQLARAAGIHLVLATQRPVVKYISGSIKANINGRVAFKTESALDSSTILDGKGAEKLLGNGDMIFKCDDGTLRAQGCFISTKESREIMDFMAANNPVQYDPNVIEHLEQETGVRQTAAKPAADQEPTSSSVDPVLIQAIELAVQEGQVSSSLLSRRFKLGYNRAARITEEMEARGVITPLDGAKPRMCLITPEQFEAMKAELMS